MTAIIETPAAPARRAIKAASMLAATLALLVAGAGVPALAAGPTDGAVNIGSAREGQRIKLGLNKSVVIDLPADVVGRCIEEVGMAFLFAPRLHPAMRHVGPVRREIGIRTIFNLLGPLTSPAGAQRQVIGVASPAALPLMAGALAALGCEHGLVVHSRDGLDEISLAAPCDAIEVRGGEQIELVLEPEAFGLAELPRGSLEVADVGAEAGAGVLEIAEQ